MLRHRLSFLTMVLVVFVAACGSRGAPPDQEAVSSVTEALSCASYPVWKVTKYVGGARVRNLGNAYECKPWPYSDWCGQVGYQLAPKKVCC